MGGAGHMCCAGVVAERCLPPTQIIAVDRFQSHRPSDLLATTGCYGGMCIACLVSKRCTVLHYKLACNCLGCYQTAAVAQNLNRRFSLTKGCPIMAINFTSKCAKGTIWQQNGLNFSFISKVPNHNTTLPTATTQRAAVILLRHKWKQTETECYYSVALTL